MLDQEARSLEIVDLDAAEMEAAVGVMVRGMRDDPNIVAAFGPDPGVRHSKLLRLFGAVAAAEVPGRARLAHARYQGRRAHDRVVRDLINRGTPRLGRAAAQMAPGKTKGERDE